MSWGDFLDRAFCFAGAHAWSYSKDVDALGRPLTRVCKCCPKAQTRVDRSFDRSGYGDWVNL